MRFASLLSEDLPYKGYANATGKFHSSVHNVKAKGEEAGLKATRPLKGAELELRCSKQVQARVIELK